MPNGCCCPAIPTAPPGSPKTFLEAPRLVNSIRGALGFTGTLPGHAGQRADDRDRTAVALHLRA